MKLHFYKYQGAGNDFVMIDEINKSNNLTENQIQRLCDRRFGIGADGLLIIKASENYDFEMIYYNSDGREASMCGNGGRCIVQFAKDLNIISESCRFIAVDGEHNANITKSNVSLQMQDVNIPENIREHLFQTGSPHFIKEVKDLDSFDVNNEGHKLRHDNRFAPEGCNVNFISAISEQEIFQRTYERGVEEETLACGTGATAGAAFQATKHNLENAEILVHMKGGDLKVSLLRQNNKFVQVWLTGPAKFVFEGSISLSD
jgi:diaminopimelate epimerase